MVRSREEQSLGSAGMEAAWHLLRGRILKEKEKRLGVFLLTDQDLITFIKYAYILTLNVLLGISTH